MYTNTHGEVFYVGTKFTCHGGERIIYDLDIKKNRVSFKALDSSCIWSDRDINFWLDSKSISVI